MAEKSVEEVQQVEHANLERFSTSDQDGSLPHGEPEERMSAAAWLGCAALLLAESAALQPLLITSIAKKIDDKIGPVSYYNWIMISVSIAQTISYAFAGGLSDIFGRPQFIISGAILTMTGLAMSLAAKTMPLMIAGMTLQGYGSGMTQVAMVCVAEIVPRKYRGYAAAAMDLTILPWTVFGPLMSLSVIKHYSLGYKICFIIGLLLNFLAIVGIVLFYRPQRKPLPHDRTLFQELGRVDWMGAFLYTAALTLILAALSLGGVDVPYKKPGFYLVFIVGVLCLFALVLWEWKGAKEPFFARSLFRGEVRHVPLCLILVFVSGMTLYTNMAFWPQQLQGEYFTDEDKIGLASMIPGSAMAVGGLVGGIGIGRAWFLEAKFLLSFGCLCKIGADVMIAYSNPRTFAMAAAGTALGAFGMGMLAVVCIMVVQLGCAPKDLGMATSLTQSLRSAGGSTALAIYSNFISTTMSSRFKDLVMGYMGEYMTKIKDLAAFFKAASTGQFEKAQSVPGADARAVQITHDRLGWVWAAAFRKVYLTSLGFAIFALFVSICIKNVRYLMTDKIELRMRSDPKGPEVKEVETG